MDINYYKQFEPIDGKWYINKELGSGSFGTVFEIQRKDFSDIKAALKVVSIPNSQSEYKSFCDDNYDMDDRSVTSYFYGFVEEFIKEFQVMARLKGNSNIVSYEDHDVKKKQDGFGWDIFIRMELLTPMNEYFKVNPPKQRDIIKIGIDICKALETCQKYNIIHRDIKPSNIFISETGEYKLGDFGVARTLEKTSSGLSKKGTYTYMAPEVFKGEKYNSNVDIYSLGILMYKLLNNNLEPFRTDRTYGDSEKAFEKRMLGASIPTPANAKGRLAEIVLKACSFNPKERYESPLQMRAELENILYSDNEKQIIYPEGDVVGYEASTNGEPEEKTVSLFGDFTEKEDKTASVFAIKNQIEKDSKMVGIFSDEVQNDDVEDDSKKTVSIFGNTDVIAQEIDEDKTVGIFDGKVSKESVKKQTSPDEELVKQSGKLSSKSICITSGIVLLLLMVIIAIFWRSISAPQFDNSNIVAVSAGDYHTVGLKSDGTIVATGANYAGQCDVDDWKDIIAVSAGHGHTVGLKSNGTVVATGNNVDDQCNVEGWEEIVAVSAGSYHTVGIKLDGTVVATGDNDEGKCNVEDWEDIIAVSAGYIHTVGLKSDGTVVATGANYAGQCDVKDWKDVVVVQAHGSNTIGLKSDGTVVRKGYDYYGTYNVEEWEDIIDVSTGAGHALGLKSNGTVVATGVNSKGQCNVGEGW